MAKSKKVKSTLQPAQLEMWNKWLAANPVGSVNNLKGVSEDEWLTKFAGGGNFGSKVGDAFKFAGDTLLSTVGATDVIGDDAYKNQGFADASRVGEKLGAGAGQMVGSFFGAGQAVKMGQQAIGAIDGTDEERARVEQLRANPEASGKYAQSIGQMNKAVMPIAGAVGAAGQIGAGAISNGGFGNAVDGMKDKLAGSAWGQGAGAGSGFMENYNIGQLGSGALQAYGGKLMPDGGSIPNVQMDEELTPGSPEYAMYMKRKKAFDAQDPTEFARLQEAYGTEFTNTGQSIDDFFTGELNKSKSEWDSTSELNKRGATNPYDYKDTNDFYKSQKGSIDTQFNMPTGASMYSTPQQDIGNSNNAKMGKHGFLGVGDKDKDYFYQYTDPSLDYDIAPNDSNLSIEEEKTFRPLQVGVYDHSSGNPTHRTAGFQYGYESEGTPEKITTVDPYTGEKLLSETDSFTPGILNQRFPGMKNVPVEYAQGGVMNKAQGDGKFVEYEGPTHAGGGIKVDAGGMPTNGQPVAEVEGGETMHDDGIESYIFSDRLVLNPGEKKKKTFADESKKINNKYKNVENDKIGEDSRNLELEELKIQQEELKQMMNPNQAQSQPQAQFPDGGALDNVKPNTLDKFANMQANSLAANSRKIAGDKWVTEVSPFSKEIKNIYNSLEPEEKGQADYILNNANTNEGWNYILNVAKDKNYQSPKKVVQYDNPYQSGKISKDGKIAPIEEFPLDFKYTDRGQYNDFKGPSTLPKQAYGGNLEQFPDGGSLLLNNVSQGTLSKLSNVQKNYRSREYEQKELDRGYGTHTYVPVGTEGDGFASTYEAENQKMYTNNMKDIYNSFTPREQKEVGTILKKTSTNEGWNEVLKLAKDKGYVGHQEQDARPDGDWGPSDWSAGKTQPIQFSNGPEHKAKILKKQAYGGNLQQYPDGGTFGHTHDGIDPMSEKYNKAANNALAGLEPQVNNSFQNSDLAMNFNPRGPVDENGNYIQPPNKSMMPESSDLNNMYRDNNLKLMEEPYVKGTTPQEMEAAKRAQSLSSGQLPQDKINPAGYFASNIGNMNDLIQSSQPTKDNDFGRMNPNLVNYDAQRKELENQAGVSRAISRENARNSGGAGSAMTNQVISNALVNSNLGSGLSQSYMGEANANAQIRNQAEQVNTNIGMQEEIANQQDQAMGDSVKSKALHSIGQNTQGYVRDIKAAEVGNMNNKMWFDLVKEGKYVDYDYKDGRLVMTTKDGRKIEMKQKENGSFEEAK